MSDRERDHPARGRAGSIQKFFQRSIPNQVAAVLAAARAEIDQIVRCTDDLFFVLDDQQGVAFVAEIVHHAHQLTNIARV